jgi:hypothetical protein
MVEFQPIELIFQAPNFVTVGLHFLVAAVRVLPDLVNNELRVATSVEAPNPELDGDVQPIYQGLVFSHVVWRRKMEAYYITHMFSDGWDEEQASACSGFHKWKSPRGGWIGKSEIYKLKHTLQAGVSVRNINESEREGENKSQANKSGWHGDLFYRGSVLANLLPVEVVTKTGSLSTLSLSQTVT